MGRCIHVVKRGGETWYRCWSTVADAYVTEETNDLEAFKQALLEYELEQAKRGFEQRWPYRLSEAMAHGTSCLGTRKTDKWDLSMAERREIEDGICKDCSRVGPKDDAVDCVFHPPSIEDGLGHCDHWLGEKEEV